MSELTELEKKIKKIIYDNSPCSMNDAAKEIALLIEQENKKVWDAAREDVVLLLSKINALFQPNDLKKQKTMWEELRKTRDEIENKLYDRKAINRD